MKKQTYLILSAVLLLFAVQSCQRMGDDDGNLLNNMNGNQDGLGKDRFLYQEVTSAKVLAQYNYVGRKLVQVLEDSAITNISYSGDLISRIDYNGVVEGDSISYTQEFNYDIMNGNVLNLITETKSVYEDIHTVPFIDIIVKRTNTMYEPTFDASGKLASVLSKTGNVVPLTPFVFTSYWKVDYTYNSSKKNVTNVYKEIGSIVMGNLEPSPVYETYDFTEYDSGINPYTLIPFGYTLHKTFQNPYLNYRFSANNPKKIIWETNVEPFPHVEETQYNYDALKYAVSGWGVVYDYRPF